MRLFIYAQESSGASAFCHFLGQRPHSIALIDVWSPILTPPIVDVDIPVVAKATTTTIYSAADHVASFVPDRVILFLRDPVAVYASLSAKKYANEYGSIDEKFAQFEDEVERFPRDLTLSYESFVGRAPNLIRSVNEIGWPCSQLDYQMSRSLEEIGAYGCAHSPTVKRLFNNGWGFGNIQAGPIITEFSTRTYSQELIAKVVKLSPKLARRYGYALR